ncbi:MAG: glycerophosphodiester phosphodiesterase, partial [Lachnospiraceae bacterium]|nr:glycerophosphodiester phosphodiesterase [Lachnospiraceae bacterium]
LASDFYKSGDKRPYMFVLGHLMFNFLGRPDFISYDCQYPDELSGRICKKLFKSLPVAWTIRSQQKLDEVKDKFALFIFEGFRPV